MQKILAESEFINLFDTELNDFTITTTTDKSGIVKIYVDKSYYEKVAKLTIRNEKYHLTLYPSNRIYDFVSTYHIPNYSYTLSYKDNSYYDIVCNKINPYNCERSSDCQTDLYHYITFQSIIDDSYKGNYLWDIYDNVSTKFRCFIFAIWKSPSKIYYPYIFNKKTECYIKLIMEKIKILFCSNVMITKDEFGEIKREYVSDIDYKYEVIKYLNGNHNNKRWLTTKSAKVIC